MRAAPGQDFAIVILTDADSGTPFHVEVGEMWITWIPELGSISEACP